MAISHLRRLTMILAAGSFLAGCAAKDLSEPPPQMGDVALGYTIVVAKNAKQAGPSRKAEPEEWQAAINEAVVARVGRQPGQKLYHLGIGVDAYALAIPGIPVVISPKSVLAVSVTLWDDTAQMKVNAEPEQFTVLESFSPETLIGSGLTQSREVQMANLSTNLAVRIEKWLLENKDWFSAEAVAGRALRAEAIAAAQSGEAQPEALDPAMIVPGQTVPTETVVEDEDDAVN